MAKLMVALITPFTKEHEVDYPALRALIARLMAEERMGLSYVVQQQKHLV